MHVGLVSRGNAGGRRGVIGVSAGYWEEVRGRGAAPLERGFERGRPAGRGPRPVGGAVALVPAAAQPFERSEARLLSIRGRGAKAVPAL